MSDAEADKIIDNARPMLRLALQAISTGQHAAQVTTIANQPLPNGQKWPIKVVMLNAPYGALIEGLLAHGIPAMMKTYTQLDPKAAVSAPSPGGAPKGFTVPGA